MTMTMTMMCAYAYDGCVVCIGKEDPYEHEGVHQ